MLLHSFYMRARSCSKPFKLGFNSTWTKNFQMYKLDLEKAGEPETKLPTYVITWKSKKKIIEKARELQENICFCFIDYAQDCWITTHCRKFLKEMGILAHLTCLLWNLNRGKKKKKQLQPMQPNTEQWTGSKLGKEYVKAVYCHPAYLNSMQSTSCKMLVWIKHKLESRLPGEISVISDMQMTPP